MTLLAPRSPSPRLAKTGVVGGIALVVLLAYAVPFLGFVASLTLPLLTHLARRHLWPEASSARSLLWSLLAWVGLWLPGVVGFFTTGDGVSTTWLMLPLCAPTGLGAVLLPALAAAATCLAGLYGATVTRTGWTWVLAAWLAPWTHFLVFALLPHEFVC